MAKRILFIGLWTVGSTFGAAVLVGVGFGIYASIAAVSGVGPTQTQFVPFRWASLILPYVAGAAALLLGILGRLPGTRKQPKRT